MCPYYKEKYKFQFCEALQDKPDSFWTQEGMRRQSHFRERQAAVEDLSSLGKRETSDALTGKQTA